MTETRDTLMDAVVMHGFGSPDVLERETVETPTPADDEVLIRTRATTATAGDCEMRRLDLPLAFRPPIWLFVKGWKRNRLIPGQEVAGEIASIGGDVTRFEPGEAVFAATAFRFGGAAEYVALPESYPIARIPDGMTVEEAATIPTGGLNAANFLRRADVSAGDAVLINGAGGSIGTYAVQIASHTGARVTAVDAGAKLDLLASLGADDVVDYERSDVVDREETYDVVVDVVGSLPLGRMLDRLASDGRYVLGNPTLAARTRGLWTNATTDRRVVANFAAYDRDTIAFLVGVLEDGAVRAVIDRRYPLEQLADAHRYVESGQKQGNVVVDVA